VILIRPEVGDFESTGDIFGAITQLRAWQGDALYDVSIVCLLLGVLLALGGGGLAFRGIKYRSSDS